LTSLLIAPERVIGQGRLRLTEWSWHQNNSKVIGSEKQRKTALRVKADIYIEPRQYGLVLSQYSGSLPQRKVLVMGR
jgi:hypothetical protein